MRREYCRAGRSEGGTGPTRDERVPMKPAMHPKLKPAARSDLKPAIVPICTRTTAIGMGHRKCADVLEVSNGSNAASLRRLPPPPVYPR
jgi:hypothetical protein